MKSLRWMWVGVGLLMLPGCGGGRLVPQDITVLLQSDTGRLALKAAEGHGGVWRWRQRPFAQFDHVLLATAQGADTLLENRGRDTTITPRLDTLAHVRETCIFDLQSGRRFARSASASPSLVAGFNGDSSWSTRDGVADSAQVRDVKAAQLAEIWFLFGLPFTLVDTTLRLSSLGDLEMVDTTMIKGREPGTFDTTISSFTCSRLKVEWARGQAPVEWMVFYIDGRDGRVRRTISPSVHADGSTGHSLTLWTDLVDAVGLKVGGRRISYPATSEGQITGPYNSDRRIYNVEFPRQLESEPFNWSPGHSAALPRTSNTDS